MEKFKEKIIDGLPYVTLFILIIVISFFIYKHGLDYDQLIGLIEVLIWPAIVLSASIFFRKVFTYLFFSMEEFNFFGTRGKLIDVSEMIERKAQELFQQKEDEEIRRKEKIEYQSKLLEISELSNISNQSHKQTDEAIQIAKKVIKDNDELLKENFQLKKEKNQLIAKFNQSSLISNLESFGLQEENEDVGLTETEEATKDQNKDYE